MPRPRAEPGIWRCGHQLRAGEAADRISTRQLVIGTTISALVAWFLWSLLYNSYLGSYWLWPLLLFTPDSWRGTMAFVVASYAYYTIVAVGLAVFFGRLGHWPELVRRVWGALRHLDSNATSGTVSSAVAGPHTPDPLSDPAQWPQMRADGAGEVADRLSADLHRGVMTDVDYARIDHAWRSGRNRTEITREVLAKGAAACPHGSGARDLPVRVARHDLALRQVRVGAAVDVERNPRAYRGAGMALEPASLATSAVVVGPSEIQTAGRIVFPVVESLCLQALAGQAAIVAVTSSSAAAPQDTAFDVVVRSGAKSPYSLELYGGIEDVDDAAVMLAEALVGDLTEPGADSRRAATALAQLIGPWRAVHAEFPSVPELRDLLDDAAVRGALRAALDERGLTAQLRELDTYERRSGASEGLAESLASRVALLDRPAFAGLLTVPGAAGDHRVFSLRHLDRPVRVRIELPERAHVEASRILARLFLVQFSMWAPARRDSSVFAFMALDDAVQVVTPHLLRGLQRLQTCNAGVLLALRTLSDVPEHLREQLLAAVGCRVACAGVSPWDANLFAAAWGTEWVETKTVTHRQVYADQPFTRFMNGLRKVVTGKHVTTEAVTVRREERQRWSPSELANELQIGHAVLSVTHASGERTPPILTKLSG